jgi:hypothetical protein
MIGSVLAVAVLRVGVAWLWSAFLSGCAVSEGGEPVGVDDGAAFPAADPAELQEVGVVGDDQVGVGMDGQVEDEVVFRVGAVVLGAGHVGVVAAGGAFGQGADGLGVGADGVDRPVMAA